MINLLIGPPGGGKSYEAVVYHVLPALQEGRKVITNLPINSDLMAAVVPGSRTLLELRTKSKQDGCTVFGSPMDYGDDWRDEKTQRGALYVIDEAHKAIPRMAGDGEAVDVALASKARAKAINEWFAEHRHEGADVLILTQSYGKLSKAITDQVQVTYRVKKGTLFGDSSKYIRKVQDGVRGDVISTAERTYEERFYPLYKSHTRSVAAVIESDASNVTPAFVKWKRASRAVIIFGVVFLVWSLLDGGKPAAARAGTSTPKPLAAPSVIETVSSPESMSQGLLDPVPRHSTASEPFAGLAIHIVGSVVRANGARSYLFSTTINEQLVATLTSAQMAEAGYMVTSVSDCAARLSYEGVEFFVRCDRVRPVSANPSSG